MMVIPGSRRGVKRRFRDVEEPLKEADQELDLFNWGESSPCSQEKAPASTPVPTSAKKAKKVLKQHPWIPNELVETADAIQELTDEKGYVLPGRNVPDEIFLKVLEVGWGFKEFRKGQLECIQRTVCSRSCLCILPTGMGKSLCYQFCVLWFRLATPAKPVLCVVISPLIALMTDQVKNLPKLVNGALMSSATNIDTQNRLIAKVKTGLLNILFISPERAANSQPFSNFLTQLREHICFACIDEAHCLSEWSHNFRPCYLRLRDCFISHHAINTVMGLTGTATVATTKDIKQLLSLDDGDVVRHVDHRDNLKLSCEIVDSKLQDKNDREHQWLAKVVSVLQQPPFDTGSVVVYVNTQNSAEIIADHLQLRGIDAISYHAECSERQSRQTKFMTGAVRVIVATVAFGMGIDKADVRGVVHLRLPPSLESYIQEIGRAGRDHLPAHCTAVIRPEDYFTTRSSIYKNMISLETCEYLVRSVLEVGSKELHRDLEAASGSVVHHAQLDRLSRATSTTPEVVETLCTVLGQMFPGLVALKGQHHTTCAITLPTGYDSGDTTETASTLTLLGDEWVQKDVVLEYIRGLQRSAAMSSTKTKYLGTTNRVSMDIVKATRQLGLTSDVIMGKIEEYKKKWKWRVALRDNAMICTLYRTVSEQEAHDIASAVHAQLEKIRNAEVTKLNICHGFLSKLAKAPKNYPSHLVLSTYTTEDPNSDFSVAKSHASVPPPPASTPCVVPHTAIQKAVRADPAALSDPLYVAKICYGILPGQTALPDHPLWKVYPDHDFNWLMAQAREAVEDD